MYLHYTRNDRKLLAGMLVLIDAGFEHAYYTADLTRTWAVGRPDPVLVAAWEHVQAAQAAALAKATPGSTLEAVHAAAVDRLLLGLIDLGLVDGPLDRLRETEEWRSYFPHGTSHWLGLEVHDPGSYGGPEGPTPLVEGHVFTVEPGLYVGARDPRAPRALRGVGMRLEDDVVITASGHRVMSIDLPQDLFLD